MASVKYSRIPIADPESQGTTSAFDYSSPFSYEDRVSSSWKYRSAFTYETATVELERERDSDSQLANDSVARLLVLCGFYVIYLVTFPVLFWFSFKRIKENERCVVFRLGRCQGSKGPGLVYILPLLDRCHKIDVHLKAFSVPPKQVITNDGAIIEVGAEIYHQVMDAEKSVKNVQNLNQSTRILVQTALCNILSQKTLAEIEAERRSIADVLMETSNKTCQRWGVEITRAELSQIKVLSQPPPKPAPTLMMPPGLMGMGGGDLSGQGQSSALTSAFMQLAKAVTSNEGQGQALTEAIAAFQSARKEAEANEAGEGTAETVDSKAAPAPFTYQATSAGATLECSPLDVDKLLDLIGYILDADLVQKVGATYHFDIEGPDGGLFSLDLQHGQGRVARGALPSSREPDVTISTSLAEFQAMMRGDLSPFHAYMAGRLRVAGDVRTAMKLEDLADRLRPLLTGKC